MLAAPHCVKKRRYDAESEDRTDEERATLVCSRENAKDKASQNSDSDGGQNQAATAIYLTHTII